MAKARVGVRLKEAIGGKQSLNRSADLDSLTEKYNVLKAKIRNLIIALKCHYGVMVQMSKTRLEVANQISIISADSPLFDCAGQLPSDETPKHSVCSYASVHHGLAGRSKSFADKYAQFVINYAIEWDKVLTNRVSVGLKEAEILRRDLDHYQKKAEQLRTGANQTMAKGKSVDSKTEERLSRNEAKLQKAKEGYNKFATGMCVLLEEVTERAWKDVHPLLVKIAQFDSTLTEDETKGLSELSQVVSKLKQLGTTHDIKPEARLKDIQVLQPALLSTRQANEGLRIEADPTASGAFSDMSSPTSLPSMPPGSMAPQGMGGYPVPVASSVSGISRVSSVSSVSSTGASGIQTMSTSDMLAISSASAPPPTMDQLNEAYRYSFTISHSEDSGGYNTPYGQSSGDYRRTSSALSTGSSKSHGPPPSAPPPPPPPSGFSMYSTASPTSNGFSDGMGSYSMQPDPVPTAPADSWSSGPQYNTRPNPYSAPVYSTPAYDAPSYSASPYGAPPYSASPYGAPIYSTPSPHGQPSRNPFDK